MVEGTLAQSSNSPGKSFSTARQCVTTLPGGRILRSVAAHLTLLRLWMARRREATLPTSLKHEVVLAGVQVSLTVQETQQCDQYNGARRKPIEQPGSAVYLFGGNAGSTPTDSSQLLNDLYRFSALERAWHPITVTSHLRPSARFGHSATMVRMADGQQAMAVFAGRGRNQMLDDLWLLRCRRHLSRPSPSLLRSRTTTGTRARRHPSERRRWCWTM